MRRLCLMGAVRFLRLALALVVVLSATFLAAGGCSGGTSSESGDTYTGRVYGTITGPTGEVASGATVSMSSSLIDDVYTASDGTFEFPSVPYGTFTVTASYTDSTYGYVSASSDSFKISAANTIEEVNITLTSSNPPTPPFDE
jgi:hypothetical protein